MELSSKSSEESFLQLLDHVHAQLKNKIEYYTKKDKQNREVLNGFGITQIDDYQIPVPEEDIADDLVSSVLTNKHSNDIKQLTTLLDDVIKHNDANNIYLQNELSKCSEESIKVEQEKDDSKLCGKFKEKLQISNDQSSVKKVMENLEDLSSKMEELENGRLEIAKINEEFKNYHGLPPDIMESENMLELLKKNYAQTIRNVQKEVRNLSART